MRHLDRERARLGLGRRSRRLVRQDRADLDVAREGRGADDVRARRVELAHLVLLAHLGREPERGRVAGEEVRQVHDGRAVGADGGDGQARHDGLELRVLHGAVDRQAVGRDRGEADRPQQHVVARPAVGPARRSQRTARSLTSSPP